MRIRSTLAFCGLVLGMAASTFAAEIMIIDSGVDYKHTVLANKMWSNPGETADNSEDDDGDGLVDDIFGWNFADNNNEIIDYSFLDSFSDDVARYFDLQGKAQTGELTESEKAWLKDKSEDSNLMHEIGVFANFVHGTHVAGIASKGNKTSHIQVIKSIATDQRQTQNERVSAFVSLLKQRARQDGETLTMDQFKEVLEQLASQSVERLGGIASYTAFLGAKTANLSFGSSLPSLAPAVFQIASQAGIELTEKEVLMATLFTLTKMIEYGSVIPANAPDTLLVIAAGNDGLDNDKFPTFPSNIRAENSISVAATFGDAKIAEFSNYGATTVDIAAPGVMIYSSIPGDKFMEMSGTSQAAPFVTNVAAKVLETNSRLTPAEVKEILMETVDKKEFLADKVVSGGIVNSERALFAAKLSRTQSLTQAIAQAQREVATESRATPRMGKSKVFVLPLPSAL
jgi:subtilisin family serine protease